MKDLVSRLNDLTGKVEMISLSRVAALPQHMAVSLRLTVTLHQKSQEAMPPFLRNGGVASEKRRDPPRKAGGFPPCAAPKALISPIPTNNRITLTMCHRHDLVSSL